MEQIITSIVSIVGEVVGDIKQSYININSNAGVIKSELIQYSPDYKLVVKKIKLFTNIQNNYIIELEMEEDLEFVDYNCYEYDIYRTLNSLNEFKVIATGLHPLAKYIDTDVNMQNVEMDYYYKVIIRNKITNETEEI